MHSCESCTANALRGLLSDACLQRRDYSQSRGETIAAAPRSSTFRAASNWSVTVNSTTSALQPQLAVFVMHYPRLRERRRLMHEQLAAMSAKDVTWMLCANREDVELLSPSAAACLFQGREGWAELPPSNGSRSIALKHLLAFEVVRSRNLPEALILEDDAVLPLDLWWMLASPWAARPSDAHILWLGGGHRNQNLGR